MDALQKVVTILKNGAHDFLFISKEWIPACAGMTLRLYRHSFYSAFIRDDTTKLFINLKKYEFTLFYLFEKN
ncbi:hypothetical protein SAMN04488082_1345 [Desulfomicrobium apsheronum]|uniref:Uncharacterized protein n=1 Tax=Desulfomicrobium apsheronum TaxID=52560 RepID=A0A1I4AC34_9BACT|nr:hypothetical protein SAMN04488082_1345 [Desulfomicrobium apsheronum]